MRTPGAPPVLVILPGWTRAVRGIALWFECISFVTDDAGRSVMDSVTQISHFKLNLEFWNNFELSRKL